MRRLAFGVLTVRRGDPISWVGILLFGSGVIVFGLLLLPGSAYLKLDGWLYGLYSVQSAFDQLV